MDKMVEKFIENLAKTDVNEFTDYRAKQEFEEFILAARAIMNVNRERKKFEQKK